MRSREDTYLKASRLISEGLVSVATDHEREVAAVVRGDNSDYRVNYVPGLWSCTCPCFGRCSHLVAVMSMTVAGGRALARSA